MKNTQEEADDYKTSIIAKNDALQHNIESIKNQTN
jgi:hypothetical protein